MPDSKSKVVELPAPVLVEAQGQSQIDPLGNTAKTSI